MENITEVSPVPSVSCEQRVSLVSVLSLELVALIAPTDVESLATARLVSKEWSQVICSVVSEIVVPEKKAVRVTFVALFPRVRRVEGWIWIPGDESREGRCTPEIRRALTLKNPRLFYPSTMKRGHAKAMNEYLRSLCVSPESPCVSLNQGTLSVAYQSDKTISVVHFERGRLTLEFACEEEPTLPSWFTNFLTDLFAGVAIRDVFLDVTKKDGGKLTRCGFSHQDWFMGFFFDKKPEVFRYKGRLGLSSWSDLLGYANWSLRMIRLKAAPPTLFSRDRTEEPLIEDGDLDRKNLELPDAIIYNRTSPAPAIQELRTLVPAPDLHYFVGMCPSVQTFYVDDTELLDDTKTKISQQLAPKRIVFLPSALSLDPTTRKELKRNKRGRPSRELLERPTQNVRIPDIHPVLGDPTARSSHVRESQTNPDDETLETLLLRFDTECQKVMHTEFRRYTIVLPLTEEEYQEDGLYHKFRKRLLPHSPFRIISVQLRFFVRDARGPQHSYYLHDELQAPHPTHWWCKLEREIHVIVSSS